MASADGEAASHLRLLYPTGPQTDESCLTAEAGDILVRLDTAGEWHLVMHYEDRDAENPVTGYVPCTYVEAYDLLGSTSQEEETETETETETERSGGGGSNRQDDETDQQQQQEEAEEAPRSQAEEGGGFCRGAADGQQHQQQYQQQQQQPAEITVDPAVAVAQLAAAVARARERRTLHSYFGLQTALRAAVVAGMLASAPEAAAARALIHELQQGNGDLTGGKRCVRGVACAHACRQGLFFSAVQGFGVASTVAWRGVLPLFFRFSRARC
jgi:hypothetical protein